MSKLVNLIPTHREKITLGDLKVIILSYIDENTPIRAAQRYKQLKEEKSIQEFIKKHKELIKLLPNLVIKIVSIEVDRAGWVDIKDLKKNLCVFYLNCYSLSSFDRAMEVLLHESIHIVRNRLLKENLLRINKFRRIATVLQKKLEKKFTAKNDLEVSRYHNLISARVYLGTFFDDVVMEGHATFIAEHYREGEYQFRITKENFTKKYQELKHDLEDLNDLWEDTLKGIDTLALERVPETQKTWSISTAGTMGEQFHFYSYQIGRHVVATLYYEGGFEIMSILKMSRGKTYKEYYRVMKSIGLKPLITYRQRFSLFEKWRQVGVIDFNEMAAKWNEIASKEHR